MPLYAPTTVSRQVPALLGPKKGTIVILSDGEDNNEGYGEARHLNSSLPMHISNDLD
jgi:hypothetical protein